MPDRRSRLELLAYQEAMRKGGIAVAAVATAPKDRENPEKFTLPGYIRLAKLP
jgi:hypothetical protein